MTASQVPARPPEAEGAGVGGVDGVLAVVVGIDPDHPDAAEVAIGIAVNQREQLAMIRHQVEGGLSQGPLGKAAETQASLLLHQRS
ncbi:hypothetical protein [Synechococcus sp. BSA11S]|uniref:hypothetical protein n=1 Tax=Synechococcales TaxID=1890424 RepID=UPI0016295054|nr:hypothetical protein [Synechococcus sp. BSA11S]